jgi:hypothetical protein
LYDAGVSSEYRDELSAAEERLTRLDAVHEERERARRRKALQRERRKLTSQRSSKALTAIPYFAAIVAVSTLRVATRAPETAGTGSLLLFLVTACVAMCSAFVLAFNHWQRRKAFERIDAELRALEMPHVRVASSTLEEALSRIAEREAEADPDLDEGLTDRRRETNSP